MSELIAKAKTTTTPKIYRDFFKSYYKDKNKLLVKITTVIAVLIMIASIILFMLGYGILIAAAVLSAGIVLSIYPRFSYRRPYKAVKDTKLTTTFEFYENKMAEKNSDSKDSYKYRSIKKVWETPEYFYIFHSKEKASVIVKDKFSTGTPEDVANLFRENAEKYEYREK